MCEIQPMIPVYLLCSGAVLILHGIVRIFASIPSPPSARRQRPARSKLNRDLCVYAIEGLVLLGMVVVVILGNFQPPSRLSRSCKFHFQDAFGYMAALDTYTFTKAYSKKTTAKGSFTGPLGGL
jgi:hypothetical protein